MTGMILLQYINTASQDSGSTLMWVVFIVLAIVSWIASKNVERKFNKYSNMRTEGGLTGREVAERMLADHDIRDVQVRCVDGVLTDNYNPTNKTLNLSSKVYNGNSVAAAAVAAHECGHAVQHAHSYSWLNLRTALVPVVNFSSKFVSWILLAGLLLIKVFPTLLLVGIALFAFSTLFAFITLPVEINASSRALNWIQQHEITSHSSHKYAESALRAAAYTYVMAALTSLATLAYYVMIYMRRR